MVCVYVSVCVSVCVCVCVCVYIEKLLIISLGMVLSTVSSSKG